MQFSHESWTSIPSARCPVCCPIPSRPPVTPRTWTGSSLPSFPTHDFGHLEHDIEGIESIAAIAAVRCTEAHTPPAAAIMPQLWSLSQAISYQFSAVASILFRKYPNDYSSHVVSVDTIDRTVDPETGVLRTERIIAVQQPTPRWMTAVRAGRQAGRQAGRHDGRAHNTLSGQGPHAQPTYI